MLNKNLFIFSVLLMSSVFVYGCDMSGFFKDDADVTSKVGILENKPLNSPYSGTHILKDEKNNITPLRSLVLNLGSSEYIDNKVQIMGFMNTKDDVFEVSGVSVMEILSKNKIDKDLVSYKNTDLGFELNYPNNWKLEELEDSVTITAPALKNENLGKSEAVSILQTPFVFDPVAPNKDSIQDALSAYAKENLKDVQQYHENFQQIGQDRLMALRIPKDPNNVEADVYLYRNGFIYKISLVKGNPPLSENKNIGNQILSSFKFTGFTSDISNSEDSGDESISDIDETEIDESWPVLDIKFSVFESLPFKFKGEYPAKWYYSGEKSSLEGSSYHYSFTETADGEELIGLDIMSGDMPSGKRLNFGLFEPVEIDTGDQIALYVKVENHIFRLSGNKQYRDLILIMSSKVSSTQAE